MSVVASLIPIIRCVELPPMFSNLRRHLPSIRTMFGSPHPERDDILAYLGAGVACRLLFDPGLMRDVVTSGVRLPPRLTQSEDPVPPTVVLTDGAWCWLGADLYYFATYHVRLPLAFIDHARARLWSIDPSLIDAANLSCEAMFQ